MPSATETLILALAPFLAYRDVVHGLIHDLRNPLQTVAFGARSLTKSLDEGSATRIRDAIARGAERSTEMIDLLSQATEPRSLAGAPSVVTDVVKQVVKLQRKSKIQIHGAILADLPGGIPPASIAEHALEISLMLVINNAKESIGLDADGEINVDVRSNGSGIRLLIADNGPGLSNDSQQIFDAFYTTKDPSKHMGLGLTAARLLLTRAGGAIHVRNGETYGGVCEINLRPWVGADA